ncbi:MAG: 4Fe-4S binding protein [Clostridiales Family XIII bacterium]|jgi:polyferredoxin|nr:4Fe-4S binding protein [Clostridiales Family XIII bacterium]
MHKELLKIFPFPEYVISIIEITMAVIIVFLLGRKICGKICPYGLLQDLIYKIKFPLKIKTFKGDKYLRYLKYILLFLPFVEINYEDFDIPLVINIISIVVIFVFIPIIISRPLCKYLCPLGIIFAIGNKIPPKKYEINIEKCTECGLCIKKCKMDIIPYKKINSIECIYCGNCKKICPCKAIDKKNPFAVGRRA